MEFQTPFAKLEKELSFLDILDNMDIGVAIYDAEGNFLFVNTVMINWRNISRSEYLKMNVHDLYKAINECVFDLVCKYKRQICRLQYYNRSIDASDEKRVRTVKGTPIFDSYGNVKYVLMIMQDVQDFEKAYRGLIEAPNAYRQNVEFDLRAENGELIAESAEFKQLLTLAENIAKLDSTVLLYGETGCGKELLAQYVHRHSSRNAKPYITVNCAALPENLAEAELFGYEKGSFTGANKEGKSGLIEAANGGTLFLDEINSLPLAIQSKMLRVIEEKKVRRIGSMKEKAVDFRLIVATNKYLEEMVRNGQFREDLYYRLNVIPLTIPPIRNRRDDIIPLCRHFLKHYCQKYNIRKTFSQEVLGELRNYDWPGNVREIRNFIERVVVMTPSQVTEIYHIPEGLLEIGKRPEPFVSGGYRNRNQTAKCITKKQILEALEICGCHREKTAEYLGISRRFLQYKIKEYHLSSRCSYD